jgi:hypothetical protein
MAVSFPASGSEAAGMDAGLPTEELLRRPFTYAEAGAAGLTRRGLLRLVDEGRVRRVLRDVYARTDLHDDLDLRIRAATLVVPPHAVVVDRTAAWIWGVDSRRPEELEQPPPLDLFVAPGHKRLTRPELRGGERTLYPDDVVVTRGLTVTTPLRTALDLGCHLSAYEAMAALDALARAQGVTVDQLRSRLPRFRGRRGVVQLRRLVPHLEPLAESAGESFIRLAIIDAGFPTPVPQHWVSHAGRRLYRLDLAYPALKICVEYDGVEYHSSSERRAADTCRRLWLREHGWEVIVVDRGSFKGAALDVWLGRLRRAIAARA